MERRKDIRAAGEERVFVRVLSCSGNEELVDKTFSCSTRNLSPGGLKLSVQSALPVGSRLGLSLGLSGLDRAFALEGQVRWLKESDPSGHYQLGIEFLEASPDLESWAEVLAERAT